VRIPRDVNGQLPGRAPAAPWLRADGQQQHPTIPAHKPLRVGTLRQILKDVASQLGCSLEELIGSLDL
jgi:hypothetical protein